MSNKEKQYSSVDAIAGCPKCLQQPRPHCPGCMVHLDVGVICKRCAAESEHQRRMSELIGETMELFESVHGDVFDQLDDVGAWLLPNRVANCHELYEVFFDLADLDQPALEQVCLDILRVVKDRLEKKDPFTAVREPRKEKPELTKVTKGESSAPKKKPITAKKSNAVKTCDNGTEPMRRCDGCGRSVRVRASSVCVKCERVLCKGLCGPQHKHGSEHKRAG